MRRMTKLRQFGHRFQTLFRDYFFCGDGLGGDDAGAGAILHPVGNRLGHRRSFDAIAYDSRSLCGALAGWRGRQVKK